MLFLLFYAYYNTVPGLGVCACGCGIHAPRGTGERSVMAAKTLSCGRDLTFVVDLKAAVENAGKHG